MVHACDSGSEEAETRESGVQGQLHCEFKTSLGYTLPYLRANKKNNTPTLKKNKKITIYTQKAAYSKCNCDVLSSSS